MNDEANPRPRLADLGELDEVEVRAPDFVTVLKVVWASVRGVFRERPGQVIGSAFILLMTWGQHGKLEWLRLLVPVWRGPGSDPAAPVATLPLPSCSRMITAPEIAVNARFRCSPTPPWDRLALSPSLEIMGLGSP